jgi:hypothetical protein
MGSKVFERVQCTELHCMFAGHLLECHYRTLVGFGSR